LWELLKLALGKTQTFKHAKRGGVPCEQKKERLIKGRHMERKRGGKGGKRQKGHEEGTWL